MTTTAQLHHGAVAAPSGLATDDALTADELVDRWLPTLLWNAELGLPLPASVPSAVRRAALHVYTAVGRVRQTSLHDAAAGCHSLLEAVSRTGAHLQVAQKVITNPEQLEQLYAADHANGLARRYTIRASVLAGGGWPRTRRKPASLVEVVRAAGGSVDGYQRAGVVGDVGVAVYPPVIEPLMAALAELLDNALRHSSAAVVAEIRPPGEGGWLWMTIADHGSGMQPDRRDAAQQVLDGGRPAAPEGRPGQGLRLVAAAARDLGLRVALVSEPDRGTRVSLLLPPELIVPPSL